MVEHFSMSQFRGRVTSTLNSCFQSILACYNYFLLVQDNQSDLRCSYPRSDNGALVLYAFTVTLGNISVRDLCAEDMR